METVFHEELLDGMELESEVEHEEEVKR